MIGRHRRWLSSAEGSASVTWPGRRCDLPAVVAMRRRTGGGRRRDGDGGVGDGGGDGGGGGTGGGWRPTAVATAAVADGGGGDGDGREGRQTTVCPGRAPSTTRTADPPSKLGQSRRTDRVSDRRQLAPVQAEARAQALTARSAYPGGMGSDPYCSLEPVTPAPRLLPCSPRWARPRRSSVASGSAALGAVNGTRS